MFIDTPLYVYDANRLIDNYYLYLGSLKNVKNFMLCYAVKANPNLALLNMFYKLGAGFDVVSGGEISRCLAAGVDPSRIIFSGCGKSMEEIELAVKSDVQCINVESWGELDRIEMIANRYNKIQDISIRVNPDLNLDGKFVVSVYFLNSNYMLSINRPFSFKHFDQFWAQIWRSNWRSIGNL